MIRYSSRESYFVYFDSQHGRPAFTHASTQEPALTTFPHRTHAPASQSQAAAHRLTTPAPVTFARGDGIGPEIMDATLDVLTAAEAKLALEEITIGKKLYEQGVTAGIDDAAWASLRKTRTFLKAPITTPSGGGYKSLNVTTRKTLGLYANVRPCVSYDPAVRTRHPGMDVVIVRENEEDTYAGIEHQQTPEVAQCLKLITRPGCERICRYAFEYARAYGRKKVSCFLKDNIHKHTDGLFHAVFDEVAAQYPDIETDHWIIDIGAARLADTPERFDVIVTPNLYGDIVSDIAAQITGSIGLCGTANIGQDFAMFEAIHGSAPDIAGQGIANPSGLLLGAVQMLVHIGQGDAATRVHNAWLKTIEDGVHTGDIYTEGRSVQRVGTANFAKAVIERLGEAPATLPAVDYACDKPAMNLEPVAPRPRPTKQLVGVDVFLDWDESDRNPEFLSALLQRLCPADLKLKMITNRGVKVFPGGFPETFCTDHWRCRFVQVEGEAISPGRVIALLQAVADAGLDAIKTENLYTLGGERGYSLGQGE